MLSRASCTAPALSSRHLSPAQHSLNAARLTARPFTQHSQLLLLAPQSQRPQLPYLYPATLRRQPLPFHTYHLRRVLSTETRKYVVEQTKIAAKWTVIGWTVLFLGGMIWYGIQTTQSEKENPTPEEYGLLIRQALRDARAELDPKLLQERGYIVYPKAGARLMVVLEALEDRNKLGKGLDDGGDILVPGIGVAGVDYTAKSWPWRAGYVETVMSMGKCAEHCENLVLDRSRGMALPADVVVGPSNPDPRPMPSYSTIEPPLEENCEPLFAEPETFYMRIITGTGFLPKHKMEAALAYANWLDFKGLHDSAGEMHKWAVDIALRALPEGVDPSSVMDGNSGILKTTRGVTPNLLTASTALATHNARVGDVASALPIFLSVLRARREAPVSSTPYPPANVDAPSPTIGFPDSLLPREYFPPPPPSGDDHLHREAESTTCEEAELMMHIGEILFASAASGKSRKASEDEGLAWTRQAVSVAENNLLQTSGEASSKDGKVLRERARCRQCLTTAVGNWEVMLDRLQASRTITDHKGWFGRSNPAVAETQAMLEADRARVAAMQAALTKNERAAV